MINLRRQQDCCGCTACVSICPKHCIKMQLDNEGFMYPDTNTELCVNCNACNAVCPIINKKEFRTPLQCYAAQNKDKDILLRSSSGGVFSVLAEYVLSLGGIVFGARWERDLVIHDYVDALTSNSSNYSDLISPFRSSKYVQSDMRDTFKQTRQFLNDGRLVLFSGTPCEIGGLKSFLKKDYDNLLAIDVACHGVPSPKVLSLYLMKLKKAYGSNIKIDFRSKISGWLDYRITAYTDEKHFFYENQKENIYMKGFLRELYSRPSCHECAFKRFRSQSDITLADFWGIEKVLPDFDYYNGASLLILNTGRALAFKDAISDKLILKQVPISDALLYNGALLHSEAPHPERKYLWKHINQENFISILEKCFSLRTMTKLQIKINSLFHKLRK